MRACVCVATEHRRYRRIEHREFTGGGFDRALQIVEPSVQGWTRVGEWCCAAAGDKKKLGLKTRGVGLLLGFPLVRRSDSCAVGARGEDSAVLPSWEL